jgi:hypothetical protein
VLGLGRQVVVMTDDDLDLLKYEADISRSGRKIS